VTARQTVVHAAVGGDGRHLGIKTGQLRYNFAGRTDTVA
jgi:hypothetical protein